MGVIRKQGIQSSILIYIGFAIGALNVLVLFPKFFTSEEYGLTFVLVALGKIILQFALLGTIPVMNKFFPYYNNLTGKKKNDFLTASFILPCVGILLSIIGLVVFKSFFIRKFYEKSPILVEYYYLIYPFSISLILYTVFETYSGTLYKTVFPTMLREIASRLFTTVLIILFSLCLFSYTTFISLYSLFYFFAITAIVLYLKKEGKLDFTYKLSGVTQKLKYKMLTYASFIFGGVFLGSLAENIDVIFIGGLVGLNGVAVYQIAHYMSTIVMIPYRSFSAIATPVLAQAWKDKNITVIHTIYQKTSLNQLISGLGIFGLIWVNIDGILTLMGPDYTDAKMILLLLGITRIMDLGFGLNSEILNTSNHWRFNFLSYVFLTIVFIGTNYFLVSRYGITGSAVSNLISYFLFNATRCVFILIKFNIQPFTLNTLKTTLLFLLAISLTSLVPESEKFIINLVLKSALYSLLFFLPVFLLKISEDINKLIFEIYSKYW